MGKKTIITGKKRAKKGGYNGNEMWRTHRLEGVVKNVAVKPKKKKKKVNTKQ
ncbi:MAG: hypothetical protein WAX85_01125 [Minisyncoccia bacterium]